MKILVKMTGSIAAFKVCALISKLVQQGFEVKVAASASALKFVGQPTLEGLSRNPVATDLWTPGQAMDHINLMRWADLILVAPASANFINSMASGLGTDLLSTLFLAHDFKKPYLVAPAMNVSMYNHPITQQSMAKLSALGLQILGTEIGDLACGEQGEGRLLEPDELLKQIRTALTVETVKRGSSVLVTSGGTVVPIDEVRVLTNRSTGRTGAFIADHLVRCGYQVTLLRAKSAVRPQLSMHSSLEQFEFETFDQLKILMEEKLGQKHFSSLVHLAAVSDFEVENSSGKLASQQETQLKLKPLPKLISMVRSWSLNKNLKLIGFKLTSGLDEKAILDKVNQVLKSSDADFVVQNDWTEVKTQPHLHPFRIYDSSLKVIHEGENLQGLGKSLDTILSQLKGVPHDLSP